MRTVLPGNFCCAIAKHNAETRDRNHVRNICGSKPFAVGMSSLVDPAEWLKSALLNPGFGSIYRPLRKRYLSHSKAVKSVLVSVSGTVHNSGKMKAVLVTIYSYQNS